jgi:outer membrane protein assembly factor BamB
VGTGESENRLYAIRDDGTSGNVLWSYPTGGAVTTKPAVGTAGNSAGKIYFGSDDGSLHAVDSNGTQLWRFDVPGLPGPPNPIKSSPAISPSGNTVYFGTNNGRFYARSADNGSLVWVQSFISSAFQSSPVIGSDGTVFVGNDDGNLYAFDGSTGALRPGFPFATGAPVRSSPALSNDGAVVYIGSENGILFAVNTSNGTERWRFTTGDDIDSAIAVDPIGHIYFGSDDNNVYALYPDGTLKWSFPTGDNVEVKPAVNPGGIVYAGSRDDRLYAINQSTAPANLKDLRITSSGQSVGGVPVAVTSENDWLKGSPSKGPWAVRLEITRSTTAINGTYPYNLRAWMRQCNSVNCNNPLLFDPLGTFFEDTRVKYDPAARPPMIEQTIELDASDHADFERFIFGFTAQTALNETQTAVIRKFQLSFIRPNDPTVESDPGWP